MNNNKIFFKKNNLTYESFKLIMFQISSNLILSKLFGYKNKIDYTLESNISSNQDNKLFENINSLKYKLDISINNRHFIMSSLLDEAFIIPDLEALMFKENYNFFIEKTNTVNDKDYSESNDLKSLASYIFISFYETNRNKIINKIGTNYFVDIKTGSINNIIWGLAKIIRDNLAHDVPFTDGSGNEIFKILKNHSIDFLGKQISISNFELKKVGEIFNSIDLIILMYLMEQEITQNN